MLLNLISNGFYAATKRKAQDGASGYEPTLAASTQKPRRQCGNQDSRQWQRHSTRGEEQMFNPFFTTPSPRARVRGWASRSATTLPSSSMADRSMSTPSPGEYTEFRIVLPRKAATLAKTGASA